MKTEILKQVSGLGLERTFLNLRLAQRTIIDRKKEAEDDICQNHATEKKKWSSDSIESHDSGIETTVRPQYSPFGSDCLVQVLLPSLNENMCWKLKPSITFLKAKIFRFCKMLYIPPSKNGNLSFEQCSGWVQSALVTVSWKWLIYANKILMVPIIPDTE